MRLFLSVILVGTALLFLSLPAGAVCSGDEFQVNTYTTLYQWYSAIAMDADGDFVVVWTSYGQDGDGDGIFAQRFNSACTPVGSEFQVNTVATDDQRLPGVAMNANGDFVIVWTTWDFANLTSDVYARRYDASGTPQGTEFRVNTFTLGLQYSPAVAVDADGNFVVVWNSDQDGGWYGIFAQRYDASGTPQGDEFQVNTYTFEVQVEPAVAMGADGRFVVVWQSFGQDGYGYGIFGQRYAADGLPQGGEFQVNTYPANDQDSPAVAMGADGRFVVAWQSYGQDGSEYGVFAQRFAADGLPQGGEFRVNTFKAGNQGYPPAIAIDAAGDFVVAWSSQGQDGDGYGVFARRFHADGTPQGSEFQVNTYTTESQTAGCVAMNPVGELVAVWGSWGQDGSYAGVFGRGFPASSTVIVGKAGTGTDLAPVP